MSDKDAVIEMIRRMPEDCSMADILDALYVRQSIEEGIADADAGNFVPHDQVKKEIKEWLESTGQ